MSLRNLTMAAALMVARTAAAAPVVFDWQPTRAKDGPSPRCFAYAPSLRAYACVGYVDESRTHRYQTVDVIGLGHGHGRRVVQTHRLPRLAKEEAKAEIDRWLSEMGFAPTKVRRARLLPGKWIEAGATRVRYDWRTHDGDASSENFGDVTVRCPDERAISLGVRARGLELGEVAWAFWRPGTDIVAISVAGDDGGEDTIYRWVNTLVVDRYTLCRGHAGVAGPVPGRNVGP